MLLLRQLDRIIDYLSFQGQAFHTNLSLPDRQVQYFRRSNLAGSISFPAIGWGSYLCGAGSLFRCHPTTSPLYALSAIVFNPYTVCRIPNKGKLLLPDLYDSELHKAQLDYAVNIYP